MNPLTGQRAYGTRTPDRPKTHAQTSHLVEARALQICLLKRRKFTRPPTRRGKYLGKFRVSIRLKILPHKLASQTSEINKALCKEGSAPSFLLLSFSSK